jgi:DNA-binding CsgD family transcriptional regulator
MVNSFDDARIISALCAAALNAEGWRTAIDTVAETTNSTGAILLPVRGVLPIVALSESLTAATETYVRDGWFERDLRYRASARLIEHGVVSDADVASQEEMKSSPYYQEFLARHHLKGWAGVRIGRGSNVWCLSIQRSHRLDDFDPDELATLQRISQHLDGVSEVAAALSFTRAEASLAAFEFANKAAVLLDRRGEVVRLNAEAETLLDDEVKIVKRRLHCAHPDSTARLDSALRRLLWNTADTIVPPIALHRRQRKPLLAYIIRTEGLTDSPLSSSHAMVVLVDPERQASLSIETLKITFGLTYSEARLAAALAGGADLNTLAGRMGLSRDTLRNQLKAVFNKTGARRQAELVAMLSHLLD